jgi:hypothetical protein
MDGGLLVLVLEDLHGVDEDASAILTVGARGATANDERVG